MTKIFSIKNVEHFDVGVDDKRYSVRHITWPVPHYSGDKEEWVVIGGGTRRETWLDPDGATFKRVVREVKAALNEKVSHTPQTTPVKNETSFAREVQSQPQT